VPEYEDDPNDPRHPDFDLSESGGWYEYEPHPKPWFTRRWVLLIVAVLVIVAMIAPVWPK
jgi:hypothetical protein